MNSIFDNIKSKLFKKPKSVPIQCDNNREIDFSEKVKEYLNKDTLPDYGAFFIWDNGTDNDRVDLIKRIYRERRYSLIYDLIKRTPRMTEYKDVYIICKELGIIDEKGGEQMNIKEIYNKIKGVFGVKNDECKVNRVKHSSNRVKEYLSKKHISVMEIGHIWNRGDDFDRITLLNKLYEEYEDYSMVINLIEKKPSMLEYPEIKKMYDHIMKIKDMEKNEELIKGWRS